MSLTCVYTDAARACAGAFTWAQPAGWPEHRKWRKRYIGHLEDGRIRSVGHASTYLFQKQIYEGEFVDGVAHGKGTMLWEDGRHYQGEWVNGKVDVCVCACVRECVSVCVCVRARAYTMHGVCVVYVFMYARMRACMYRIVSYRIASCRIGCT